MVAGRAMAYSRRSGIARVRLAILRPPTANGRSGALGVSVLIHAVGINSVPGTFHRKHGALGRYVKALLRRCVHAKAAMRSVALLAAMTASSALGPSGQAARNLAVAVSRRQLEL